MCVRDILASFTVIAFMWHMMIYNGNERDIRGRQRLRFVSLIYTLKIGTWCTKHMQKKFIFVHVFSTVIYKLTEKKRKPDGLVKGIRIMVHCVHHSHHCHAVDIWPLDYTLGLSLYLSSKSQNAHYS